MTLSKKIEAFHDPSANSDDKLTDKVSDETVTAQLTFPKNCKNLKVQNSREYLSSNIQAAGSYEKHQGVLTCPPTLARTPQLEYASDDMNNNAGVDQTGKGSLSSITARPNLSSRQLQCTDYQVPTMNDNLTEFLDVLSNEQ